MKAIRQPPIKVYGILNASLKERVESMAEEAGCQIEWQEYGTVAAITGTREQVDHFAKIWSPEAY